MVFVPTSKWSAVILRARAYFNHFPEVVIFRLRTYFKDNLRFVRFLVAASLLGL